LARAWRRTSPCIARPVAGRSALKPGLLQRPAEQKTRRLAEIWGRAAPILERRFERSRERLDALDKLRQSFNPDGPWLEASLAYTAPTADRWSARAPVWPRRGGETGVRRRHPRRRGRWSIAHRGAQARRRQAQGQADGDGGAIQGDLF